MKNTLIKVWGVVVVVAILAGLLSFSAVSVSAGYAPVTTQIATPTAQLTTGTSIDFMAGTADGQTLFVYSNANKVLYKSTNGGTSFAPTSAPATASNNLDTKTITGLAVSSGYASDSLVVATEAGQVWVSTNGGATFNANTNYAGAGTIQSVAVGPAIGGGFVILIGTSSNMYIFTFNSYTWATQVLTAGSVLAVSFSPNYSGDVEILAVVAESATKTSLHFKVSSGAWDQLGTATFTPSSVVTTSAPTSAVMAFGSDYYAYGGGQVLVGLVGSGVDDLYSATMSNLGGNWSQLKIGGLLFGTTSVYSVAVNGTLAAGKIYVGHNRGVSKAIGLSTTTSWIPTGKGPFGTKPLVDIAGSNIIVGTSGAGAGSAFQVSTDDAATFNGVSLISVSSAAGLKAQNFSAADAKTIFLVIKDGANYLVFKTADGGSTWSEIYYTTTAVLGAYVSPSYATDNTVYVVTGSNVQVSSNGGTSFVPQYVNGSGNITAFLAVDGTTYYAGFNSILAKSGIFASSSTGLDSNVTSIALSPSGEVFVGQDNGKVFMAANGVNFTAVGTALNTGSIYVHLAGDYATSKKIYAVSSVASTGFTYTVGTSLTWSAIGLSSVASANLDLGIGGEYYYSTATTYLGRGLPGGAVTNDNIDPSLPAVPAPSAPWLIGADFDWVQVITAATGSNTLIALAGNATAPTSASLYSPAYAYSFRLVNITDNFVVKPSVTYPTAAAQTSVTPTITWSAVAGATLYRVQVALSTDPFFITPICNATSGITSYSVPAATLTAGKSYLVQVRVEPASPLVGYWSAAVAFTVKLTENALVPPNPVAPIPGAILTAASPTFQWTPSGLASTYDFVLSDKSDVDATGKYSSILDYVQGITNNLYSTSVKLKPGAYYWEVRAVAGNVVGDWIQSSFSEAAAPAVTTGTGTTGGTTTNIITATIPAITVPTPNVSVPAAQVTVNVPTPTVSVAENTNTPAWVWVIIVIGAVLVIAVVVLIVRTRRV